MIVEKSQKSPIPPKILTAMIVFGIATLGFIAASIVLFQDLMNSSSLNSAIPYAIPIFMSIVGLITIWLLWKRNIRLAGLVMATGILISAILEAIFNNSSSVLTLIPIMVIILLPMVAILTSFTEIEFIVTVFVALLARAVVQIIGSYKPLSIQIDDFQSTLIRWGSIVVVVLFGFFITLNLRSFPFRTKMILVLGFLTIVPATVLMEISQRDLQNTLIDQANESLVLSANQLSSAVDTFIDTTLDNVRTDAQLPAFEDYLGQTRTGVRRQGTRLEQGTQLERAALDSLLALSRKDPINILSYKLIDSFGLTQLSTSETEIGVFDLQGEYFLAPMENGLPYVSKVLFTRNGQDVIHFSSPVRSASGELVGVLDVTYAAIILQQMAVQVGENLGSDVSIMLLDENQIILAHNASPDLVYKIVNPPSGNEVNRLILAYRLQRSPLEELTLSVEGLTTGLEQLSLSPSFSGIFNIENEAPLTTQTYDQAGAMSLESMVWKSVAFIPQSVLLAPVQQQIRNLIFINIFITLATILIVIGITQLLVSPILQLRQTSEQIIKGDINATASVRTNDEIGSLATSFNAMTEQLRGLLGGLEEQVAERTQALEIKAVQLQAAADVGRTAAQMRDPRKLLSEVSKLISNRFGFYHVGIFLLDELNEFAVLEASNSEGGQRMLSRNHKLKIGEKGIVGMVAQLGKPRIALDVGVDAAFFANPDLPETRSEMALPLTVAGSVLGVLDVQSTKEAAFSQEDITTLQVLADQLAVSIENARLFEENINALNIARKASGEVSRESWESIFQSRENLGYIGIGKKVAPIGKDENPISKKVLKSGETTLSDDRRGLFMPLIIRGETVGVLNLVKSKGAGIWSNEDVRTAEQLTEQLSSALDSARLYNDISRRAELERIISESTTRIGSKIDMDAILQSTVAELGNLIGDSTVSIQIQGTGIKEGKS